MLMMHTLTLASRLSLVSLVPHSQVFATDVCVPITALAQVTLLGLVTVSTHHRPGPGHLIRVS
jgi:hypothetical protein